MAVDFIDMYSHPIFKGVDMIWDKIVGYRSSACVPSNGRQLKYPIILFDSQLYCAKCYYQYIMYTVWVCSFMRMGIRNMKYTHYLCIYHMCMLIHEGGNGKYEIHTYKLCVHLPYAHAHSWGWEWEIWDTHNLCVYVTHAYAHSWGWKWDIWNTHRISVQQ